MILLVINTYSEFVIVTKPCEVITNEAGDVNLMFSQKVSSKGPLDLFQTVLPTVRLVHSQME